MESQNTNLQGLKLKGEGFVKPDPNPENLRLYGNLLCPYVERVRHTFALKDIKFQFAEIDFPTRPEWFMQLPSQGKVPLVEVPKGEKLIYESSVVAQFVEECKADGYKMLPEGCVDRAYIRILMIKADNMAPDFYKLIKNYGDDKEAIPNLRKHFLEFENFLKTNVKSKFFLDLEIPTFADVWLFPHFRRLMLLEGSILDNEYKEFKMEEFPHLMAWYNEMVSHPIISQVMIGKELFQKWYKERKETGVFTLPLYD